MADIGTNVKSVKIEEYAATIIKKKDQPKFNFNNDLVENFLTKLLEKTDGQNDVDSHIVKFFRPSVFQNMSLHYCSILYEGSKKDPFEFMNFCKQFLTKESIRSCMIETLEQSGNKIWFELRYGRITASKLYEASNCTTFNGSLVESLLGLVKINAQAVERGKNLEQAVLSEVQKMFKTQIKKCGLILSEEYPIFGASPDGITNDAVYEVKCPFNEKNIKNYYDGGKINNKVRAQLQLQMFLAKKNIGYLCIASPNFEKDKKVTTIKDEFSSKFFSVIIKKAITFWIKGIFPNLMNST